jgi:trans-aconitate methyltransferase
MQQPWNAQGYAREGRFVADLARDLVADLAPRAGERILDVGCGDGELTAAIAASGARVVGVDSSAAMVEAARARGLEAHAVAAEELAYESEFDAVFSNAALHWVRDQDRALAALARALRPGGRLVAEMGGHGNIASISVALSAVMERHGLDDRERGTNYFPTPAAYGRRLEQAGFAVESIRLIPRPTPLPGGMRAWLELFRRGVLDAVPPAQREAVLEDTVRLLAPVLRDEQGNWVADYVRLRFRARRPA